MARKSKSVLTGLITPETMASVTPPSSTKSMEGTSTLNQKGPFSEAEKIITQSAREQARKGWPRNPQGYKITDGNRWARLFEAVRCLLDGREYAEGDKKERELLSQDLDYIMRPFHHDPDIWRREGRVVFHPDLILDKHMPTGRDRYNPVALAQRIAVSVILYFHNQENYEAEQALRELYHDVEADRNKIYVTPAQLNRQNKEDEAEPSSDFDD